MTSDLTDPLSRIDEEIPFVGVRDWLSVHPKRRSPAGGECFETLKAFLCLAAYSKRILKGKSRWDALAGMLSTYLDVFRKLQRAMTRARLRVANTTLSDGNPAKPEAAQWKNTLDKHRTALSQNVSHFLCNIWRHSYERTNCPSNVTSPTEDEPLPHLPILERIGNGLDPDRRCGSAISRELTDLSNTNTTCSAQNFVSNRFARLNNRLERFLSELEGLTQFARERAKKFGDIADRVARQMEIPSRSLKSVSEILDNFRKSEEGAVDPWNRTSMQTSGQLPTQ